MHIYTDNEAWDMRINAAKGNAVQAAKEAAKVAAKEAVKEAVKEEYFNGFRDGYTVGAQTEGTDLIERLIRNLNEEEFKKVVLQWAERLPRFEIEVFCRAADVLREALKDEPNPS